MPLSNIRIIHEDAALLVVDKPTLLLSVPGRAEDNRDCLVTRLQENGYPEARIVHRLDWETSGVIVLARDATAIASCPGNSMIAKRKRPTSPSAGANRRPTAAASNCRCATTRRPSRAMWWITNWDAMP